MNILHIYTASQCPSYKKKINSKTRFTCTSISCVPTDFIRMEKSDRSTLGRRVASAKRIATDMIPSKTAKPFLTCFLKMHFQKNSAK